MLNVIERTSCKQSALLLVRLLLLLLGLVALGCTNSSPEACSHQTLYTDCMRQVLALPPRTEVGWAAANHGCFARANREVRNDDGLIRLLGFSGCRK